MPYSLINANGQRKYLTISERSQFLMAVQYYPPKIKTFCLMIAHTGCLLNEALNMKYKDIDFTKKTIAINCSRKRSPTAKRTIPLSNVFLNDLQLIHKNGTSTVKSEKLWSWTDRTGQLKIKQVMKDAGIEGPYATATGLRHGFGIYCVKKGIPLNYVQKWLGHSYIETTSIYLIFFEQDERTLAERLWD